VSDKLGRIEVAAVFTCFCGVTRFAIWIPAKDYAVAIVFAIISGAVVDDMFWMVSPELMRKKKADANWMKDRCSYLFGGC
jgi:hypothetical protein